MSLTEIMSILSFVGPFIIALISLISVLVFMKKNAEKDGKVDVEEAKAMIEQIKSFASLMSSKFPNAPVNSIIKQMKANLKLVAKDKPKEENKNSEEVY